MGKPTEEVLDVQMAIRRGLDSASRGELVEQDEVERRMARWLGGHEG